MMARYWPAPVFAFWESGTLAKGKMVLGEQMGFKNFYSALRVVRQNLWWAAIYNAVCVPLAVAGWLPAWLAGLGMALSSLLVVLNALRLSDSAKPRGES